MKTTLLHLAIAALLPAAASARTHAPATAAGTTAPTSQTAHHADHARPQVPTAVPQHHAAPGDGEPHDEHHHDPAQPATVTAPPMHAMHDHAAQHDASTEVTRSADYSDGLRRPHDARMHAAPTRVGMFRMDKLEAWSDRARHGQRWELDSWYGGDLNRVTVRSEGERATTGLVGGDLEALWSRAASAFWDTQLGLRHELGSGTAGDWLAIGVAGLAPYLFELRATAYLGRNGRTALRFAGAWDWRWTQQWILTPELESTVYGKADTARDREAGVADVEFGLRLRYEVRREFAPYAGVVWQHHGGRTRRQWVAGLRFWF